MYLTALVVAVGVLAVGAGTASAHGGATLTLGPAFVDGAGNGVVQATFTNTGTSTLTHVVVTISVSSGGTFSSSLGDVAAGGVAVTNIAFTDASGADISGNATWDAGTTSHGKGGSKDSASGGSAETPNSVDAWASGCSSASSGGKAISVSGDGCSTAIEGIDSNGVYFVKGIAVGQTATVTLTFPDDGLPFSVDYEELAPLYLDELPNYPTDTETTLSVPACPDYVGPPTVNTDSYPLSTDSCIEAVNPTDDSLVDDNEPDFDAGTITLLVTGTPGDPGYVGGR